MLNRIKIVIIGCVLNVGCNDPRKATTEIPPKPEITRPKPAIPPPTHLDTDQTILVNLKKHRGLAPVERGGGGRCLFHSLRSQVSPTDLTSSLRILKAPRTLIKQLASYALASEDAQADTLRQIAIFVEQHFFNQKKSQRFKDLTADEQVWVLEMAKDWYTELSGSADKARVWFLSNSQAPQGREDMWRYVKDNRNAYWKNTSCETNWAGSSEAIVFARLLKRTLTMYGLDRASSEGGAPIDKNGVVMPYLNYAFFADKDDPLLIWQTGGGGHYQQLVKQP